MEATENVETSETAENVLPNEREILLAYGTIFNQLLLSDKFRLFMDTYYTVQKLVDEEKREITLQVIENPPEVVAKKIEAAAASALREESQRIQIAKPGDEVALAKKIVNNAREGAKKGKIR